MVVTDIKKKHIEIQTKVPKSKFLLFIKRKTNISMNIAVTGNANASISINVFCKL